MLYFLNLAINFLLPGLVEWWSRWTTTVKPVSASEAVDSAKALAALAGILILGLGGVLIIGLSGRWVRRWLFRRPENKVANSPDSVLEKIDWARPLRSNANDSSREFTSDSATGSGTDDNDENEA